MSTTTVRLKAAEIYKDWHVIDAAGRPLGRVASEAATLLRGKHKPFFEPHLDVGDFVIIVNAAKVTLSGNKSSHMRYYRHSGYPGGLKTRTFTEQMGRSPAKVLEQAVWGMLPKGPLGKQIFKHLKVYAGPDHPHQSQVTGSERARAVREAAQAEAVKAEPKVRRLRPLTSVHSAIEEEAPAKQASAKAAAPAPQVEPPSERQPDEEPTAEAVVEEAVTGEVVTAEPTVEEAEAKPARSRRKKADEAEAEAPADAEETPKRSRSRKADEPAAEATTDAEAEAKPRRTRRKKTEEEES